MRLSSYGRRLATGLTIAFLFAPLVSRVAASKPDRTVDIVVNAEETTTDCGFPVTSSVTGRIETKLFFDKSGTFVRDLVHAQLHGTFTNPDNGVTLPFVVAENSSFAVNDDDTATLTINGLTGKATVPHFGQVAADVGRLVLFFDGPNDDDPDVVFESGHHDNGPFPTLCSFLQ